MTQRNGSTSKAGKAAPAKAARPKAAAKAAPAKAAKPAPAKAAKPAAASAGAPAAKAQPPATPVNKVAKKDHKHFEGRLLEERGRLLKELATSGSIKAHTTTMEDYADNSARKAEE